MLSPQERDEIAREVHREMVDIEHRITHDAGSYRYMCLVEGVPTFTHTPCGPVIRRIA